MSQGFHPAGYVPHYTPMPPLHLDIPMIVGAIAVAMMFICRWRQSRTPLFVTGVIVFGFVAGVYGFIAGAWPLGAAEIGYAVAAYHSWWKRSRRKPIKLGRTSIRYKNRVVAQFQEDSRLHRMFG